MRGGARDGWLGRVVAGGGVVSAVLGSRSWRGSKSLATVNATMRGEEEK